MVVDGGQVLYKTGWEVPRECPQALVSFVYRVVDIAHDKMPAEMPTDFPFKPKSKL